MTEELTVSLFQQSTEMYRKGNYPVCLALLNDCILLEPNRAVLFCNRAIAHYHLQQLSHSISNLQKSIQINHLNYVAYFNLFSILMERKQDQKAFRTLCLGLSAALTSVVRHNKRLADAEKSIQYSYNNKQSIFLKSMIHLQQGSYQQSLQYLQLAGQLQNNLLHRRKIRQFTHYVETLLQKPLSPNEYELKLDEHYALQTNLEYSKLQFQRKIESMVKQFNDLYWQIGQIQRGWRLKQLQLKDGSSNSLSSNGSSAQEKIEKQTNCVTTYDSNFDQDSGLTNENSKSNGKIELDDFYCTMREDKTDRLNLDSIISQDKSSFEEEDSMFQIDEECQSKIHSYLLYPLRNDCHKVIIFIEKAQIQLSETQKQIYDKIYTIFTYNGQSGQQTLRTCLSRCKQGLSRWQQWTDPIELSANPSNIHFKVFNKTYTSFKDELIGQGQIELNSLGYTKIPFFKKQQHMGEIQITVEISD